MLPIQVVCVNNEGELLVVEVKKEVSSSNLKTVTAQKTKFSIKDFFSKCDQIRRKLRIWSHLQKKSLMENFLFCAVYAALRVARKTNHRILLPYNVCK